MEDLNLFDFSPEWSLVTLDDKVSVLVPADEENLLLDILRTLSGYIRVRRFEPVCGLCARIRVGAQKSSAPSRANGRDAHRPRP